MVGASALGRDHVTGARGRAPEKPSTAQSAMATPMLRVIMSSMYTGSTTLPTGNAPRHA